MTVEIAIGPFRVVASAGDGSVPLEELEKRLPRPNSLRRAGDDAKRAVGAAHALLEAVPGLDRAGLGLYVAQHHGSLEYSAQFLQASWRDGPRLASPALFSESVANNAATHLSLSLGLTGLVDTFIGTRAAGIQAVQAAAEDVRAGVTRAGLVVVVSIASAVLESAYGSVFPHRPPPAPFVRGAVAFLVRPGPGAGCAGLRWSATRCDGRSPESQRRCLESIWHDFKVARPELSRLVVSAHPSSAISADIARDILDYALSGPADGLALDPFLRLLADSKQAEGPRPRSVVCLSEEGTCGILAVDGPVA